MPSLLFVAAHPDDDTFGVARSIALHASDPDLRLILIYATDGEAGEIAPDSGVTREGLAMARRMEAKASWDAIGRLPDRCEWFALPDGGLADLPPENLVERILAVIDEERPDVVYTFGHDGITGHLDHLAVSAATTEAFLLRADDGGPGLKRLLYAAIPQSWVDRWNQQRRDAGLWEWDATQPYHLRGVEDEAIGVDVDTTSVVGRAVAAIRCHKTQWSYQTMEDDRALAESLQREHAVVVWPARKPGEAILRDIFEGI